MPWTILERLPAHARWISARGGRYAYRERTVGGAVEWQVLADDGASVTFYPAHDPEVPNLTLPQARALADRKWGIAPC